MAVNKYPAPCAAGCGGVVPANGGSLKKVGRRWEVRHLACADGPAVISIRLNSGAVLSRNARGRCLDAPCCGCCTA
jgi:hypothetical protein